MICPRCKEPLVEVDNPMRPEFRHKRGTTCRGVPADQLATEYLPPAEQEHDTTGRLERLTPAETMERDAREGRTSGELPDPPPWDGPELLDASETPWLLLGRSLPDPYIVQPNPEWNTILEHASSAFCAQQGCDYSEIPCRVHYLQVRELMTRLYEEQQVG